MTGDDNRSAQNLILLCLFHSRVVDDFPDDYPADVLRTWKEAAESEGPGDEGSFTEDEAAQILVHLEQPIHLNAQTITLGGTLGGGGGAIGHGAVGGSGGDITMFPELRPKEYPPPTLGDVLPLLGEGLSLGSDGQPGGLTAFIADSKVVVAAGAGGGGFAGTGFRSTSTDFALSTCMMVNRVEFRDGLAFVLGGGWASYSLGQPQDLDVCAVLLIEAGGVPEGEYTFHATVAGPDGVELARDTFPVTVMKPGALLRIPRCVVVRTPVKAEGLHTLRILTDVATLAEVMLAVTLDPPAAD